MKGYSPLLYLYITFRHGVPITNTGHMHRSREVSGVDESGRRTAPRGAPEAAMRAR